MKAKFDKAGWDKLKPALEDFTPGRGQDLADSRFQVAFWPSSKGKLSDPDFWPCSNCAGQGKIYDPDEPIDPVEGRKFAKRIACPECRGTGNIGSKRFRKEFKEGRAKWNKKMAEYKKQTALLKNIFRNLSQDEHEALYKYYHR
jgi:hypothetical protein